MDLWKSYTGSKISSMSKNFSVSYMLSKKASHLEIFDVGTYSISDILKHMTLDNASLHCQVFLFCRYCFAIWWTFFKPISYFVECEAINLTLIFLFFFKKKGFRVIFENFSSLKCHTMSRNVRQWVSHNIKYF